MMMIASRTSLSALACAKESWKLTVEIEEFENGV
jgi:hypothetical protein